MAGYALTALFAYLFVDLTIIALPISSATIAGLAVVIVLWWLIWRVRGHHHHLASLPIHFGLLMVFLFAHILATALSFWPQRAIEQMAALGIALTAFLTSAYLIWPRGIFLGALRNASWVYVAAVVLDMAGRFGPGYRPPAPNTIGAIFALLLIATLAEMFDERPRWPRLVWVLVAFALIFVTASRGAWFGLAAGLLTLAWRKRASLGFLWPRVRRFWPVGVFGVVIALSAGALWQFTQHITDSSIRFEFWELATAMFLNQPLIGYGPGSFALFWSHLHSPPFFQAPHAHSIIFNTAAEQGLIGLTALAVLAIAVLRASWRDAGLFAVVVAFGAHSLVDSINVIPEIALTFAVLLGSRLVEARQHEDQLGLCL